MFASEDFISCFFPLFSRPPFVHMEDLAHCLKNYMILSTFAYNNNNNNNYKGGAEWGIKKRVIMTSFLVFV